MLWFLFLFLLTLCIAFPLSSQAGQRHERFATGRILVTPRHTVDDAQFTALAARHGGKAHSRVRATRLHIVDVAPGQEEAAAQALALDPQVEFAEVDRLVDPEVTSANDPYYSNAWHLAKIGTPIAWDTAKGAGVTVAILDSGVDGTHPDLVGKLVPGWNLVDNNSNTSDVYGHGTMVAGVVGAASNNGIGATSIAWDASLMPVRVALTSGSAYISAIANGIIYAADHGAQIANASFATLTGSPTIQSAANYMRSKGGLVVVAAGNYGVLDSTPNTGAVISVSATGSSDALTSWSSYGPYVDVSAPGSSIMTTTNGGGYAYVSGTSFSSPATCAVLALMKSANPTLSNVTLEAVLKSSALDLGTPGYDQYYGYGRINAAAAVTAAAGYSVSADTQAPTVSISSPTGGTVSSTVAVNIAASDNVGVTRVDLYKGATLIASSSTAPYSINWDTRTIADGAATLTAYAYDIAGNTGSSASVTVSVSNAVDSTAPTVSILSPTSGTVTGTVTVKVSAGDNVGVTQVDLYVGSTLIGSRNTTPYTFTWNTRSVANGTQTLTAYAKDKAGNRTRSTTVSVKVANVIADTTAPTVTILSPTADSSVSGYVTVKGSASDNVRVTSLALYIDGVLRASTKTASLSYRWNTRRIKIGVHTLSLKAKDAAGNTATKSISVNYGASTVRKTRK
jgi:subtilisin family serine protease